MMRRIALTALALLLLAMPVAAEAEGGVIP